MTSETRTRFYHRRAPGDLVFLAAVIIAVIIIAHIIFVLLNANGGNDIVSTDADWASWFATWFLNLFTPDSHDLNVTLNYGVAALFYLVIGGIARRLINDL
jgi:ABC-type cobalt transport system substrate-binding protein